MSDTVSWRDRWNRFEACVGLVAAFALTFGPLALAILVFLLAIPLGEWKAAGLAALVAVLVGPMAIWLSRMATSAMERFRIGETVDETHAILDGDVRPCRTPFALILAQNVPRLSWGVRVLLAVWWLAHFAAGTALGEYSEFLMHEFFLLSGVPNGLAAAVFAFAFHFASNIFLVLAVTQLFNSQRVVNGVWRQRLAVDALFTCPLVFRLLLF